MADKEKKEHFVVAITKVLPEEVMSDDELMGLKSKIIEKLKPLRTELEAAKIEPIAFGLSALIVRLKIPEETEGGTSPIEEAIETLEEVQRVEVMMVSRM